MTPDADQIAAAETLSHLVDLATEDPTGEPDLHHAANALDPDQAAAVIAVAAAVIATDRQRADELLNHAAQANRALRHTHDRYLEALRNILATTASTKVRRIVTDTLGGD